MSKALSAYNDAFFTVDKRENPGKYAEKTVANNSSSASQVQIIPQNHTERDIQIRLPKIELPTFSGSYEEWCTFNDTFLSLIHNNSQLSNIQKFHYLKSALKGNAASVIHSFEITSKNYKESWDLLKSRFDNKR